MDIKSILIFKELKMKNKIMEALINIDNAIFKFGELVL